MPRKTIKERLLVRSVRADSGCLEWHGKRDKHGYGRLTVETEAGRKDRFTHRLAYEEFVGPLNSGDLVLHKCDNPPCFEPTHLYVGTQAQNVRDAISRNRHAAGDRSGRSAKINGEIARAIFLDPRGQRRASRYYGLCEAAIFAIRHRRAWVAETDGLVAPIYEEEKAGEMHPFAKLTSEAVKRIFLDTRARSVVAREYGVGPTTIFSIWHRHTWRHATEGLKRP
ncbi:MAG: HNH endonuclease [Rhodocyclaceae bacterium]|nr:HNH endonuclease [Rhodocyclaceae bacterium]